MSFDKQVEQARVMAVARNYEGATALLEKLVAQEGAPAALFANLGMMLARLGRDDEAIAMTAKAVEQEPKNPQYLKALAKSQRKARQFDAAEVSLIRAIALDASSAQCHQALGALFLSRGRFLEAADCFREMTRLVPEQANAYQKLGQALQHLTRFDDAVIALETALKKNPKHAPSFNSMGVLRKKMGRLEGAVQSFREAVKADPDMKEAHNNLANALRDTNALDEAAEIITRAIARWPEHGEFYNSRGVLEQQSGEKDTAVASFMRAIELDPNLSSAFHNLTAAKKVTADDPVVSVLIARAVDPTVPPRDSINYNFALGKALADVKSYSESFMAVERGNLLRRAELDYDASRDQTLFHNIKKFFAEPDLAEIAVPHVKMAKRPIFILGMPRSGTSLSEQIVSAHPDVYGCGELEFLNRALKKMPWLEQSVDSFDYNELRKHYTESVEGIGFSETVFTDKMPLNFRWIGWILKAFPEAKIVHMVRNPMAVCWSNYQRNFRADGMAFTFDQEDLGAYCAMYQDLMAFWHKTFPGQIFDFVYEDLTEDQEGQSRRLCNYLGLPWDDRMLSFEKNKRAVRTASSAQVREKIYQGSSEEWRNFEKMLGPMKEKLKFSA